MSARQHDRISLDRRFLIGVAAATRAIRLPAASLNRAVQVGNTWLAIDEEARRLMGRWSRLESAACRKVDWIGLTDAQKAATSFGAEMNRIDEQLAMLLDRREEELAKLARVEAQDLAGVATKLAVAFRLIKDEDSRTGKLIAGALADVRALPPR